MYILCNRYIEGGTCPGDSGGPFVSGVWDGAKEVTSQIGLLHGGLEECSNVKFPAIYLRLDSPTIHQWLRSQIDVPKFWSSSGNFSTRKN